ncbi:kinase-like domain-containing protein [Mycena polygramma]|nr:kinase-like domain-containing protein [Mycena polygramma]
MTIFNTVPCGGPKNVNHGCMEVYPRATPGELCQRCQKINNASSPAEKKTLEKDLKSCDGCGLSAVTMRYEKCGTCRRLDNEENGEPEDQQVAASRKERHDKIQRSLGRPLQNVVNQPLGASTPLSELEQLKSSAQKGMWTIIVQPHRGATKDKEMGKSTHVLAGETPMQGKFIFVFVGSTVLNKFTEVKIIIISHYNIQWTSMKGHALSLKPDECTLRFPTNVDMVPSAQDMMIQELYTFYQARGDRALVNVDAKLKLPKGTSLVLELHINQKMYEERVLSMMDDEDEESVTVGGKRRKGSSTRSNSNKRVNSGPASKLTSNFNPDDDYSVLSKAPATSKVEFTTVCCMPEGVDGRHVLSKDDGTRTGTMEVNTLILSLGDRGKSKDVRKFNIDGDAQAYVAKEVFDLGKGRGVDVTAAINQDLLSRDLVRLKRLAWFREAFLKLASDKGLDELADFSVSDAFLILVQQPAPAEGTELASEPEPHAYLVEPLRGSSVVNKFTGTFGASIDTDKLTSTVLAFNHFVMHDTACLLAVADLQGSRHKGTTVLFDPMTHTMRRKSGMGDHGPKGILETIDSHVCNIFCKALDLSSVAVLRTALQDRIEEQDDPAALVSHQSSGSL